MPENSIQIYFVLRGKAYFDQVLGPVFNEDCLWQCQEFAKSRGMINQQGLVRIEDKEKHNLPQAFKAGLTLDESAEKLSNWEISQKCMPASQLAAKDSQ